MLRRGFLAFLLAAFAWRPRLAHAALRTRVRPGMPDWPAPIDWDSLRTSVGGRLQQPKFPALDHSQAAKLLTNPFYVGDEAALTQSSGWLDAWQSAPSAYAVHVENAADVAHAVQFAQAHRLRLVVKGGGHSYHGGSNAPDSLLVWTRWLNAITVHDNFVPADCMVPGVPAVSVGSGCLWLHVYNAVTTKAGRYVQGGGCTTVGVAGHVQGGGFGSFSKQYGLAAASLLEAEIVTANGDIKIVNARRDADLFWALKGGGGGTFGVVTRLTLQTHDLPKIFGAVRFTVQANSDTAYRALMARFFAVYASNLFNAHWGEQVHFGPDNRLEVQMMFQGLDQAAAHAAWQSLADFASADANHYTIIQPLVVLAFPAQHLWDEAFLNKYAPTAISQDSRAQAAAGDFWWHGDGGQVGIQWHSYTSAWLPAALLQGDRIAALVAATFAASRHWTIEFHFNKGLAGGNQASIAASRNTPMNPQVLDAFALVIIAAGGDSSFPGMPTPDISQARSNTARVQTAMNTLREVAPDAGHYLSECDYFNKDWQQASWGEHWAKLSEIKTKYDPEGLFIVHHGVGSEAWTQDGFSRL